MSEVSHASERVERAKVRIDTSVEPLNCGLRNEYVSSTEFRHRVESIAEAFVAMEAGLQEEKRATQRQWAKREKQIEQVILNTAGMYGELQALAGLPDLPALTAGGTTDEPEEHSAMVLKLPRLAIKDVEGEELPF
jgi:Uncharacterized protein conserved in bacteria (DUF2130)